MNRSSSRFRLLIASLAIAAVCLISVRGLADSNHGDLENIGLTVHWEANIGGSSLSNGDHSFVIWPHSTARREYVTVRSGSRIIERIRGDEVDQAALDQAILKGERLTKSPRLGLQGAKAKAEKLVATYNKLGRKVEAIPFSQQLTYLVTLTQNGILKAIDAESGSVLWTVEVGESRLPTLGPGVSDQYVAVTNGMTLYIYELETGNLVNTRRLAFTPTGSPGLGPNKAIVPSIEGRLIAYDIANPIVAPITIRNGHENRGGLTVSANRDFVGWPSHQELLLARIDGSSLQAWTSVHMHETMSIPPVATDTGFVAISSSGTVFHCNLNRADSMLWKTRLSIQASQPPVVGQGLALVVSDEGFLYALHLEDGTRAWPRRAKNVREILGVGKNHVYVKDFSNTLTAIDIKTGLVTGTAAVVLPEVLSNAISDRFFVITKAGQLTCLREIDASEPTFSSTFASKPMEETKKPTVNNATKDTETTSQDDGGLFDDAGAMNDLGTSRDTEDDPFKTPEF